MVVARYSHGQLVIIDRLREMVRLAAGIGEDGRLDKEPPPRVRWPASSASDSDCAT